MKYEEIELGSVHETRAQLITTEDVIAFASDYDPQPMHTDPAFAEGGPFGGLIASGFHTMSIAWSLWMTHGVMEQDGQGGISLDDARWFAPTRPGDRIRARVTISERRLTTRGRGFIRMDFEVLDHDDSVLMSFSTTGLLARRADGLTPGDATPNPNTQQEH
ncbi:MaoC domain protein [Euzebya pacifica]|uniref:MaoC domain protein n=1 Tax=Euzebya pacifica TaxID=1608957 RepID=A0A346XWX9_9ACTN|nr:MaoC/PaaZ C-terminal domain-containing protein [Euzebya pacifica]AXV06726.1 MaoC domain protein [Euzebya pacifica]